MGTTSELEAALAASRELDAANATDTGEIYAFVLTPKIQSPGIGRSAPLAPQIVVNSDAAEFAGVMTAYEAGLQGVKAANQTKLDTAASNVAASSSGSTVPVG